MAILWYVMSCCLLYVMAAAQRPKLSLWRGAHEVQQFSPTDHHKSREASFGVWIKNGEVYKLFSKEKPAKKVEDVTKKAIAAGVPTPAITPIVGTWIDKDGKSNRVWASLTAELYGRMFQLSKRGHLTVLEKEIQQANNRDVWTKTLQGVTAAVVFKVSDPQGFFNATHDPPISFIDMHESSTPATGLVQIQTFVENLLK